MCWLKVKFVSDIWRAWDSQLSFSSKMKVHLANCLRRTRRKYLNVTGLLKQEPAPALMKFYPHISFLLRLHFLNLHRPDKHDDVFDQHVYKGGHGGWQRLHWNWDSSSKWEFKLLCDLATKEKGAIITFAMIQPKIEDLMFTVDLVVSKDKWGRGGVCKV